MHGQQNIKPSFNT